MRVEGIAQQDGATGEYAINEIKLAMETSPKLAGLVKSIIGGMPVEYFMMDKTKEWVQIDMIFCESAVTILYDLETGNVTHEQMGLETIKRFIKEANIE